MAGVVLLRMPNNLRYLHGDVCFWASMAITDYPFVSLGKTTASWRAACGDNGMQ